MKAFDDKNILKKLKSANFIIGIFENIIQILLKALIFMPFGEFIKIIKIDKLDALKPQKVKVWHKKNIFFFILPETI